MNLYLSLKLLFSFKRKTFHSFFLILSVIGIFLGVLSLLLIISFMESAQRKIRENYLKREPHITLSPISGMFFNEDKNLEKKLNSLKENFKMEKVLTVNGFYRDFKGKITGKDTVDKIELPIGEKGQTLCFTIPEITLSPFGPTLKKICLKKEKEGKEILVPLKQLQTLMDKEKKISFYHIYLEN
ncbi:MAG: hypothetical protein WHV67_08920, partial [Thermoanaerobaculia bacterium]